MPVFLVFLLKNLLYVRIGEIRSKAPSGEGVLFAVSSLYHKNDPCSFSVSDLAHYYAPCHQRQPQVAYVGGAVELFRYYARRLVEYLVFRPVDVLRQALRLVLAPSETVLSGDIPACLVASPEEESLIQRLAIIVYSVVHDVGVRVVFLFMGGYDELGVRDVHPVHIFTGEGQPKVRCEFLTVFRRAGEDQVTDRVADSRAKGGLKSETLCYAPRIEHGIAILVQGDVHAF